MKGLLKKIEVFNKKTANVMLSLAMLLTIMMPLTSVIAYAEEIGTIGDVTWTFEDLDEDGTKETLRFAGSGSIGDYMSSRDHIDAPWEVEGFNNITSLIFEDGITVIGDGAFKGNENLESVTILDQTNKLDINWYAFSDCTNITKLSIGNNVTIDGESAFENIGIKTLTLNGNNISTYLTAFAKCSKLEEVIINGDNCYLAGSSFNLSNSLKRLVINGKNVNIEPVAFGDCGLEEVIFTNKNQSLNRFSFDSINRSNLMSLYLFANGFKYLEDWFDEGTVLPDEDELGKIEESVYAVIYEIGLPEEGITREWQNAFIEKAYECTLSNPDNLPYYVTTSNKTITFSLPLDWECDDEPDALGMWYGVYLGEEYHIHRFDNSIWKYDETRHWHDCEVNECNYKINCGEHDGDTCSICGKAPIEVSIIHKADKDFDISSDTPSKSFTQGQTSESTIHIAGLTPEKVGSADTKYTGVLVKNGDYTLEYGEIKDYTITNGSLQVNLTKKYLDNLPAGTHDIKVYVKLDGEAKTDDNDYIFDVNVIINAKSAPAPTPEPSNPGSSPRPGYKAPNTGVSGATTMILNNGFIE